MSKLRESTVQDKAIHFLTDHYRNLYEVETVYSRKEVKTNRQYKSKRADGLLCFNSFRQKEHTISIEAKSHRTLNSLVPFWNDSKFGFHFLILGALIATVIYQFLPSYPWYWMALILVSTTILSWFTIILIFTVFEINDHKTANVVKQALQYPANEKWIAISRSSYNLLLKRKTEFKRRDNHFNLIKICQKNNIGLLVISRHKTEIMLEPNFTPGYYLDSYCIKASIQDHLKLG